MSVRCMHTAGVCDRLVCDRARTAQDILAERRSVIQEQRKERDQMARAILQYQINELDRELRSLDAARAVSS